MTDSPLFAAFIFFMSLMVFFSVVMFIIIQFDKRSCYLQTQSFKSEYILGAGCMVEINGKMIPWDHYKVIENK
jgi:hypothetical protein